MITLVEYFSVLQLLMFLMLFCYKFANVRNNHTWMKTLELKKWILIQSNVKNVIQPYIYHCSFYISILINRLLLHLRNMASFTTDLCCRFQFYIHMIQFICLCCHLLNLSKLHQKKKKNQNLYKNSTAYQHKTSWSNVGLIFGIRHTRYVSIKPTLGQLLLLAESDLHPANTRRSINVGLALVQRRRRWTNVKPTLIQRIVSDGQLPSSVRRNPDHVCSVREESQLVCWK